MTRIRARKSEKYFRIYSKKPLLSYRNNVSNKKHLIKNIDQKKHLIKKYNDRINSGICREKKKETQSSHKRLFYI
jgi:hypothetical protein